MLVFKLVYWLGVITQVVVRTPYQKTAREGVKTDRRVSRTENILLGLLSLVAGVLPLIYSVTHWLDFADYHLPVWMGWSVEFSFWLSPCSSSGAPTRI